jgi:hypothetical protein
MTAHDFDDEMDVGQIDVAFRVQFVVVDLIVGRRVLARFGGEAAAAPFVVGQQTLGYTDSHDPFERRLLDADDDAAPDILAQQQDEGADQRRIERRQQIGEAQPRVAVVGAGDESAALAAGVDFRRDRPWIDRADPLDAAVDDRRGQFVGDGRDREDVIHVRQTSPQRRSPGRLASEPAIDHAVGAGAGR